MGARKCKGIGEVAVMELAQVGGKTRARSLAMAEASAGATKRRKLEGGESESGSASSSGDFGEIAHEDRIPSTVPEGVLESCCSSNGYPPKDGDGVLEIETSTNSTERRDRTPSSGEYQAESEGMESTAKESSEVNFLPKSPVQKQKVSAAELEGFFAEANKEWEKVQKEMSQKYNFDFDKEVPLEGRFEWIPVNSEEHRKNIAQS